MALQPSKAQGTLQMFLLPQQHPPSLRHCSQGGKEKSLGNFQSTSAANTIPHPTPPPQATSRHPRTQQEGMAPGWKLPDKRKGQRAPFISPPLISQPTTGFPATGSGNVTGDCHSFRQFFISSQDSLLLRSSKKKSFPFLFLSWFLGLKILRFIPNY